MFGVDVEIRELKSFVNINKIIQHSFKDRTFKVYRRIYKTNQADFWVIPTSWD
ncbi:18412_t:CDS:2 [Gigaspora rosea]|nr:18412_t:CDS:2 [Gigaspora rosea]